MSVRGLLLGVDVGTQMTKGVLCTTGGDIVSSSSVAHPTLMPKPGWYEQDAEQSWWAGFCQVSRDLLLRGDVRPSNVLGVGCSSMTPNTLLLDDAGLPLHPAILYCDSRSTEMYPGILDYISEEEIFAVNGFPLTAHGGWQGGQVLWLKKHRPEAFSRAAKVVGTTNYLVYRLTGQFVADYALARCNVPFYDQLHRSWKAEFCDLLQVPIDLFPPRIGFSADIAGRVTPQAASETGLEAGTPVVFGAMDTNSDMLAAGVTQPGHVGLAYGTALIGTKCLPEPYSGTVGFSNDYVVPHRYLCGSGVQTGGALTRWFRDVFGRPEVAAESDGGTNAFAALAKLANQVPPGSEGLFVVPIFSGERSVMDGQVAPGAAVGLSHSHSRAHLYRAILEGSAFELRRQLEQIAPWIELSNAKSVGGGTKNRAWTQTVSDVLGVEQRCFPDTAGAPFGDAFLAGLGVGCFSGFGPLEDEWIRGGYMVRPHPADHETYERLYSLYVELLEALGVAGTARPQEG